MFRSKAVVFTAYCPAAVGRARLAVKLSAIRNSTARPSLEDVLAVPAEEHRMPRLVGALQPRQEPVGADEPLRRLGHLPLRP
jgi:hypothetical protein